MASARTEHYDISLRRGHSLKQSGPTGTAPTPSPEKPSEGKVWAQAHQQVKPIWRLEKKHVGTLSAGLGPGLLGAPPQPAYFFCPSTLCSSGTTAVTAGHSNCCYLHSLPDLFSSTLLYRRSNYRHKAYQQLESFCLRSSPSEKKTFLSPSKEAPCQTPCQQGHVFQAHPHGILIHGTILLIGSSRGKSFREEPGLCHLREDPISTPLFFLFLQTHAEQQLLHAAK